MWMNDVKRFFKNFRQYPALGIALAIAVVAILYYVYKQNSGSTGTTANVTSSTSNTPEELIYSFMPTQNMAVVGNSTSGGSATIETTVHRVRAAGAYQPFDSSNIGPNIVDSSLSNVVGHIPWNTPIKITGPAYNNHYPINYNGQSAFIATWDVT
jgi:hypothetical protein